MKHSFVSAQSDGADATQVRPSNWDANHVVSLRRLSTTQALTATDDGIIVTSGTITLTLPKLSTVFDGQAIWIKNKGAGVVTIIPDATIPDTIDNGLTSWILPNPNDDVEMIAGVTEGSWQAKGD